MDLSTARGAIHNCKQYADYKTIKSKVFPSYFAGHDDKHRCRATALQYAGRGGTCGFYQKGRDIQVQIGTKLDMVPDPAAKSPWARRRSKWKSPYGETRQSSTSTSIRTTTQDLLTAINSTHANDQDYYADRDAAKFILVCPIPSSFGGFSFESSSTATSCSKMALILVANLLALVTHYPISDSQLGRLTEL